MKFNIHLVYDPAIPLLFTQERWKPMSTKGLVQKGLWHLYSYRPQIGNTGVYLLGNEQTEGSVFL